MSSIVWKGIHDDESASQNTGSMMDENSDDDSDDYESDDDDDGDDRNEEDPTGKIEKTKTQKLMAKAGGLNRKSEMEMLRANFNTTDEFRTPRSGESLREFYRFVSMTKSWIRYLIVFIVVAQLSIGQMK